MNRYCEKCKKENLLMYYFNEKFICFKCFKDVKNNIIEYKYYL